MADTAVPAGVDRLDPEIVGPSYRKSDEVCVGGEPAPGDGLGGLGRGRAEATSPGGEGPESATAWVEYAALTASVERGEP